MYLQQSLSELTPYSDFQYPRSCMVYKKYYTTNYSDCHVVAAMNYGQIYIFSSGEMVIPIFTSKYHKVPAGYHLVEIDNGLYVGVKD